MLNEDAVKFFLSEESVAIDEAIRLLQKAKANCSGGILEVRCLSQCSSVGDPSRCL